MEQELIVQKALNNNVIIAEHPIYKEVVLIGKGIGFNRKFGDKVTFDKADKTFLLKDKQEKEQYVNLMSYIDKDLIDFLNDILIFIEDRMEQSLNEHIHVALTDHLSFAINRVTKKVQFSNPFLFEIESLYPKEYQIAKEVVEKVKAKTGLDFPEGEIGFIALHIHSAVTDKSINDINRHHKLISKMVNVIEENLKVDIKKNDVNYNRLIQHLHRAIDRAHHGEKLGEQKSLADMLKLTYPLCYNLSWKLIKVMQKQLNKPVDETEALYLTIHLQRLTNKI
ncbi:glucose PTS transporter transcription antiterminator GlcT [Aquibacillus rhizosphaerae]|uniref:PRD domain-containing protein n=1 Tax=Aquibacillus rhizosphaerae TaxID=3051431 RepID=A0ABT7L3N7_9BACI|nr:PRD domain-containing protein [Aquibacillus sp. LR5S19]MDL4840477.1 PRD domain-containing protein [Aquibacillus sp. LR5S19]